jgi:PEP-CTERM motif
MRAMVRHAVLAAIASLGAIGLCARPAAATEELLTYTGTVDPTNSQDPLNVFGGSIIGQTVVVRLLIQTDPSTADPLQLDSDMYASYAHINAGGAASPILAYSVTVGSITSDLCSVVGACDAPDNYGGITTSSPFVIDFSDSEVPIWTAEVSATNFGLGIQVDDLIGRRLPQGSDLVLPPGAYSAADGYFLLVGFNIEPNDQNPTFVQSTDGALTVQMVPEPATWALMIAGFGLTGAALRRRRAAFVSQPA